MDGGAEEGVALGVIRSFLKSSLVSLDLRSIISKHETLSEFQVKPDFQETHKSCTNTH